MVMLSGCTNLNSHEISDLIELDDFRITVYSQKNSYKLNEKAELKITIDYTGDKGSIQISGIENLCQVDVFRDREGEVFIKDELFTYDNFTSIENDVDLSQGISAKGNYIIVVTVKCTLEGKSEVLKTLKYQIRVI